MFEHSMDMEAVAETMVHQLSTNDLLCLLEKISNAKNEEQFDRLAAALFERIRDDWS